MKSLETVPVTRTGRRPRLLFEEDYDDEPTTEIYTLRSVIGDRMRAMSIVDLDVGLDAMRRLLVERRIPAIAVVDGARQLVGIVTRTDILRAHDENRSATAADIMSSYVFALPADSPVEKAAALMAHEGVGQVIVIGEGGELLGMVSALDVARHCAVIAGYLAA